MSRESTIRSEKTVCGQTLHRKTGEDIAKPDKYEQDTKKSAIRQNRNDAFQNAAMPFQQTVPGTPCPTKKDIDIPPTVDYLRRFFGGPAAMEALIPSSSVGRASGC